MTRNVNWIASAGFTVLIFAFATVALHAQGDAGQKQQGTEALLVKAQAICPVTGQGLNTMGGPVRASVGDQTVFFCCKACVNGRIDETHWQRVQANLIAAQGKCPVMGNALPKNPASVVVNRRRVFVCCPPCVEKIKAQPRDYLETVDRLIRENVSREPEGQVVK